MLGRASGVSDNEDRMLEARVAEFAPDAQEIVQLTCRCVAVLLPRWQHRAVSVLPRPWTRVLRSATPAVGGRT
jgi:hypothetical protein